MMKFNITTLIGVLLLIAIGALVFLDQNYSKDAEYHFELIGWQVLLGVGSALALIILPEADTREMIKRYFNKKIDKE